jgi:formylglycine-generating enzyme
MKQALYTLSIFCFSLLLTSSLCAQCSDYLCVINKVKKAIGDKNYRLAFEQLESAEGYPDKKNVEISELRKQLFNAIEGEKNAAIENKRLFEETARIKYRAFGERDAAIKESQRQANTAKREKERSENLLKELRVTANQAVQFLLNEIDRNILRLEYDSTFEKCQIALNLKSEKLDDVVKRHILEIAFWYTETGAFNAAIKMLNLLEINALPNRIDLLSEIQRNCSLEHFTFLKERYYPKMILVEGGMFIMLDKNKKYDVHVDDFKIAETETTIWQYFLYLKANHQKIYDTPTWQYSGDNPMVYVSWYDAVEYANWVSKRQGKTEAYYIDKNQKDPNNLNKVDSIKWIVAIKTKGYRLPNEAEWEYAARGGKNQNDFRYSGDSLLANVSWYSENSSSRTQPVRYKKPNALGLFDMSGNVCEWCNDWYSEKFNLSPSNYWLGVEQGKYHSLRGGSWYSSNEIQLRVLHRDSYQPFYRVNLIGFRLVESLKDK